MFVLSFVCVFAGGGAGLCASQNGTTNTRECEASDGGDHEGPAQVMPELAAKAALGKIRRSDADGAGTRTGSIGIGIGIGTGTHFGTGNGTGNGTGTGTSWMVVALVLVHGFGMRAVLAAA